MANDKLMDPEELKELIAWLETDEAKTREVRAHRLFYLLEAIRVPEHGLLFNGDGSVQAFDEVRLAYLHGLYLATVLLSLALIENEIAGELYAAGWEDAAEVGFKALLSEAHTRHWVSDWNQKILERLDDIRNSHAHFRPLDFKAPSVKRHKVPSITLRSADQNLMPYEIYREDAEYAIEIVGRFLLRRLSPF